MRHIMNDSRHKQSKILTGIFVIFFGVMYLLSKSNVAIPHWILTWQSFVIVMGFISLYRHNFRHFFGYAAIIFGGIFIINEFKPHTINGNLFLPVLIIVAGVMILGKATNFFGLSKNMDAIPDVIFGDDDNIISSDDYIKTTVIFGGNEKTVISKDFKGADINVVFGGAEINLMQADIQQPIVIKTTATFGGLTLIVPSSWTVKSDVTSIFGGVQNKNNLSRNGMEDPNKVVILKGTAIFGGVEVKSYA